MPDSGHSNVLKILPDGTAQADFTGHVSAAGVDLVAAPTGTPPNDRTIRWHKDTITGAVVATIAAYSDTGLSGDGISVSSSGPNVRAVLVAGGAGQPNNPWAQLIATQDAGSSDVTVSVRGGNNLQPTVDRLLLDDAENSDFLQLGDGAAAANIYFSEVETLTWPGGSDASDPTYLSVPPGPAGSAVYWLTPIATDTVFLPYVVDPQPTGCEVWGLSLLGTPPAGHTAQFYWFAITR